MNITDNEDHGPQSAAAFKTFMLKNSTRTNLNLYDHLTQLLIKVMDERPENVVDVFEDMSLSVKQGLFQDKQSALQDLPAAAAVEQLAEQQWLLFVQPEEPEVEDELVETHIPNVNELGFYLEQAGVGLGREEMQRLFLALKQLVESESPLHCRLWGKILGTESNYIIAEAEYREAEEEEKQVSEEVAVHQHQEKEEDEMDAVPQSTYKPPPVVPEETIGSGTNKFVYYVCKVPGLPWTKLPAVTPAQITSARHIRRFFTGRLDSPVVSPQGFFQAREEEGDEEDEAARDSYEVNEDFEGIPIAEMVENLSSWVHHIKHILKQGRCTWVNMAAESEEESNEDGEAEEKDEEPDEAQPEVGPPLLSPLSQDADMFKTPAWSAKISSALTPQHAVAVLRSNLWPGSYAYASGKKFGNIYVGWGMKYAGEGYSPHVPPPPQEEYPSGPEITETLDPSLEEEQMLKEALEEQQAAQEEMEDADADEEEEEEDDD
ncbi:radial spoke head protein 6 homolog A isoform X2 [Betta splendens]|uniref:Radial spoke head protein 6 homolog A isoform X2 n=1 Tax=Betta splendens TaxID=158456 RepID=A0A8M1HCD6_BETSP|nr:radial spoke head protein 6 homolog A isoform X2 [Betta splendens]